MPLKLMLVAGARPNFMKVAPLLWEIDKRDDVDALLVHTGQHYDEKMSQRFFAELAIPRPDENLEVGSGSHAVQTAEVMKRFETVLLQHKPDAFHVFIYAPLKARILRLRTRLDKGVDIEDRIRKVDGERARYLQQYWGKSWCNLHLYDLMISSQADEAATARVIQFAMSNTP